MSAPGSYNGRAMTRRRIAAAFLAAIGSLAPAAACAQDVARNTVGMLLSQFRYDEGGLQDVSLSALGFSYEHAIGRHFGIEGRLLTGTSPKYVPSTHTTVEVDNALGLYGKGYLSLTRSLSAYGMLGVTRGQVTATNDSVIIATVTSSSGADPGPVASGGGTRVETASSYGVGAEYEFGKTLTLSLEWAHLFEGSGFKVEGLTVRLGSRF
jgi:hypothetical protein